VEEDSFSAESSVWLLVQIKHQGDWNFYFSTRNQEVWSCFDRKFVCIDREQEERKEKV